VDDDQGVPLPALACLFVADTAPDVDDLLTAAISAAGATEFPASDEVVREGLANSLEAGTDVPVYDDTVGSGGEHWHQTDIPLVRPKPDTTYTGKHSLGATTMAMCASRATRVPL
jgi:hypothetical protein